MSLFQNSVLNNYLKGLESKNLPAGKVGFNEAYERFKSHFHNPTIQENIRNSKEEQYQGEFLIDLFVNVLGYVKNPTPDFNLTTELKNIKGSKKTDGAIMDPMGLNSEGNNVLAIIELKGTNTTDLSKVETQAFGYKNNQPGCHYVITSNFEKLRFYIDNAVDFEEFNLFQLSKDRFKILWLCLSSEYLLKDIPKKIKDESLTQEEDVTKKLYKDYASFRNEVYNAIQKENPKYDKLTLFKKTQKLLDRFLFIFFAEDRLLLPPNSIRSIVKQWTDLRDKYDAYIPLYERFKKYFGYMNTGHKGQQHDIFAYNGGLFAPDEILDTIKINDDLLYKHTLNLSNYDFESEVSVNILGHIFEHSLNDIDEIQSEIAKAFQPNKTPNGFQPIETSSGSQPIKTSSGSQPLEASSGSQPIKTSNKFQPIEIETSKRKKDGVFYTPKYITKYIVDHTVGKLCEEKKTELDIQEIDYEKDRKGRQKTTLKKLSQKLEAYRTWLLQITICDPACGSGAFLNQALEFLIAEHQYIDELQAKLFGDAMILSEVENSILENNLFGVDINEESVEIAKLSLWLRTAQKGRKLTALNNNIKCGNSLIDDPSVAGDKAFNWQNEFPGVFKEDVKHAYHLVFTTHNSRTSQRMSAYGIKKGVAVELSLNEEIALTKIFKDIVLEYNYNVMAYNICKDHVHIILVCQPEKLSTIVKILKGRSSYMYQSNGFKPIGKSLWSQKYFFAQLDELVFADIPKAPGYVFSDSYLDTATNYIESNRSKHKLPQSDTLKNTIADFTKTKEEAFAPEYSGGFDVVIGNPPYVRQELFKDIKPYLEEHYKCYNSVADLYTYFIEQGINLMNTKGLFSFILPNKFLKATYGKNIRQVIKEQSNLELLFDFDDYPVFADATTYPIIFVLNKRASFNNNSFTYSEINKRDNTSDPISVLELKKHQVPFASLSQDMWNFIDITAFEILNKLEKNSKELGTVIGNKIYRGLTTGRNEAFVIDSKKRQELISKNNKNGERIKVLATGKEVKRNTFDFQDKYLLFTGFNDDIPNEYPDIQKELDNYKDALMKRYDQGENYWNLRACAYYEEMQQPKIIYPRINNKGNFYLDAKGEVFLLDNNFFISTDSKALLALLNSKLIYFYLKNVCTTLQGGFYDFRRDKITTIPVNNNFDSIENELSYTSHKLIDFTNKFHTTEINFVTLLKSKYKIEKTSKKLQNWHELEYDEFLKELEKARKKSSKENDTAYTKLSLNEEAEWMAYFNEQKQKATSLKIEIDKTDKEIDQMVYNLYGLTAEEITIVEEATK